MQYRICFMNVVLTENAQIARDRLHCVLFRGRHFSFLRLSPIQYSVTRKISNCMFSIQSQNMVIYTDIDAHVRKMRSFLFIVVG